MDKSSPPSYMDVKEQYPTAPVPNNQPVQYNQPMQHNQPMPLNEPAQINQMPSYGIQQPNQMPQSQFGQQYYPQSGGQVNFPLQQQAGPNTILIAPVPTNYGPHSQSVVCPSCGERVETKVTSDYSYATHVVALMMCLMGCFLCSCIPYFVDSLKNQNHYCPQCNAYLGTYSSIPQGYRRREWDRHDRW